jgi:hypothetical protein
MRVLIILGVMLVCPLLALSQVHSIAAAEYFFDVDPGTGNGTALPIVPGDEVSLGVDISTAGLSPGIHLLHLRMQRDDGVWGETIVRKVRVGVGTAFEQAEAFFDTDPGIGNGLPLNIAANGVIDQPSFAVPDIGRGFHTFSLRVFSGGTWSIPAKRTLRLGSALIDHAEAYFDTDPGEGNGFPIDFGSGADVITYDSTVSVAAGGLGIHVLFLRFRGGGVWSFPIFRSLRIGPEVNDGVNRITGGEFFIDSDPGIGNGCTLLAEDGAFDDGDEVMRRYIEADMTLGQHTAGIRVKDAGDRWYGPLIDTLNIIEAHLVATTTIYEETTPYAVLSWNRYPEAITYRVHYDSLETGAFDNFITVSPPDTSLLVEPTAYKRLYKVVALQIAPEPCGEASASQSTQQILQ